MAGLKQQKKLFIYFCFVFTQVQQSTLCSEPYGANCVQGPTQIRKFFLVNFLMTSFLAYKNSCLNYRRNSNDNNVPRPSHFAQCLQILNTFCFN